MIEKGVTTLRFQRNSHATAGRASANIPTLKGMTEPLLRRTIGARRSPQAMLNVIAAMRPMGGRESGITTLRNTCSLFAPSMAAASSKSFGNVSKKSFIIQA